MKSRNYQDSEKRLKVFQEKKSRDFCDYISNDLIKKGFKGIGNGETVEKYYLFLQLIQKEIKYNNLYVIYKKHLDGKPIAKAIDKYNYSKYVLEVTNE
jgi:hypothetical protein